MVAMRLVVAISVLQLAVEVTGQAQPWTELQVPRVGHETRALASGDIDRDGDIDLVLGNCGVTVLWVNQGKAVLQEVAGEGAPHLYAETNAIALMDFDGDQDLDIFSASGGWLGAINNLLLNDGRGRFVDATDRVPQDYGWTNDMAVGDVDGDGDLDLLMGRLDRSDLLLNDGNAEFTSAREQLPELRLATMAVALADFDGDSDLDAFLGNSVYERNRIWINDGTGRFVDETAQRLPEDKNDTVAVAVADVDGDQDLDLICGNGRLGGEQPRIYLNQGDGTFRDATTRCLPEIRCETRSVLAVDVDLDEDLDLVLGNADASVGAANLLWLNDGRGRFEAAPADLLPDRKERTAALLSVDLDADGVPELVVGNAREGGAQTRVLRLPGRAGRTRRR